MPPIVKLFSVTNLFFPMNPIFSYRAAFGLMVTIQKFIIGQTWGLVQGNFSEFEIQILNLVWVEFSLALVLGLAVLQFLDFFG